MNYNIYIRKQIDWEIGEQKAKTEEFRQDFNSLTFENNLRFSHPTRPRKKIPVGKIIVHFH